MGRPKTQANGQIVRADGEPRDEKGEGLRKLVKRMSGQLEMALPKHLSADRLLRVAMTAITNVPRLADCTPGSFIACLLTAAQLGLEPNTPLGQGYLIPRKMKGIWTCTWQTGYQGYIDLAYRSGMVTGIDAEVVRDGDHFVWVLGLDPKLEHIPSAAADRERRAMTHSYSVVRIRDAHPHFRVLSIAQVEEHKQLSDSASSSYSPWKKFYAEMAKKTAIKAALKYAPKSAELQRAEALEDSSERGGLEVVIDPRVAEAIASQGLMIQDVVDPGSSPGSSGTGANQDLVDAMVQATGASPEQAAKMLADGWELDTASGEPIPPPPPEASE